MTEVALRRLFRVVNGGTPTSDVNNWDGGIPWATPVDVGRVHGGWLRGTDRTLSLEGMRTGSAAVPAGALVISTRAPIGYVAETTAVTAFNQGCRGLVPTQSLDVRFYRYVLVSMVERLQAAGQGSTFVELSSSALAQQQLPGPAIGVQRAIADFLDTETARIDALITKKRRMADLLNGRRWIAFLAQVDGADGPRVPLRRALRFITDGPFGSAFTSAEYTDEGLAVIRLGNIGFAEFRDGDMAHLPSGRLGEFIRYQVREGDLLFAGLGDERNHAGRACVAPDLGEAIVKGKCFCARLDPTRADPDFVAMYFSSPAGSEAVAVETRGSTRSMINLEIVKSVVLPLPDVEVQRFIAARTRREWKTLDMLVRGIERQIALLHEHRQALITAAVTGELEVPGAAA